MDSLSRNILVKFNLTYLFVIFLTFSNSNCYSQISNPLMTCKFELIGEKIFIKAKINDKTEIDLQFDTGAGSSVINDSLAQSLGIIPTNKTINEGATGSDTVLTSINNSLNINGLFFKNITFLHLPLNAYKGKNRDGIIGYDMLSQYIIKIDYDKMQMEFYDFEKFKYKGKGKENAIKIWSNSALAELKLTLNDSEVISGYFMVDNGGDLPLMLNTPIVNKYKLLERTGKIAKGSTSGSDGTETPIYRGQVMKVEIGGFTFNNFFVRMSQGQSGTLSLNDLDGILGNPVLKMFNITFDYSRKVTYWEPNHLFTPTIPRDDKLYREVEKFNAKQIECFKKGDLLGVAKFYADNATIFHPGEIFYGRDAIDKYWLDIQGGTDWKLIVHEVGGNDNCIWVEGKSELTTIINGKEFIYKSNYIVILQKDEKGDYKIYKDIYNQVK